MNFRKSYPVYGLAALALAALTAGCLPNAGTGSSNAVTSGVATPSRRDIAYRAGIPETTIPRYDKPGASERVLQFDSRNAFIRKQLPRPFSLGDAIKRPTVDIITVNKAPVTGEAAGHLLLKDDDDRCFSLASRSFWKLTKADGVWLSATPDENIKINQRIDFSSIWILPCSTCVHIATYRENGRILGIAMGSPPAQTALSFAEPHPLMLHCIGSQSKQFQFLQQTIDAGSSEVTGYWAIAPLMDDKGEWIPPDQAIGEYVVVRDTSRSPLVPIDPKYPAGIDLFAGRSLLSICRAVADPDNRSWQVTAAGRKRLAPNLHTVYAAAQNNLYARSDLDEGPVDGQLVFGRVIQTRPPHGAAGPWTFNPRGAEVLRRTVTTAPAAPATQPTQPPH